MPYWSYEVLESSQSVSIILFLSFAYCLLHINLNKRISSTFIIFLECLSTNEIVLSHDQITIKKSFLSTLN